MNQKIISAKEGKWIEIGKIFELQCCDCGLLHKWELKVKNNKVYIKGNLIKMSSEAMRRLNNAYRKPVNAKKVIKKLQQEIKKQKELQVIS